MPEQQNANQIQQINIKDSFNTAMSEIDQQKFREMDDLIKKLNDKVFPPENVEVRSEEYRITTLEQNMTKLEALTDKLKVLALPKVETLKPTLEEIEIENSLNMFQKWLNENLEKEFKANTLPSTGVK